MTMADLIEVLDFNRQKTLAFVDSLAKQENVAKGARLASRARPGPHRLATDAYRRDR